MIAAIYARKSTDQSGVADDQKSVARQVEHARAYAERKGWTVDDACIFVDDGISGAEFANRPGFLRLMNALKPRPPFQVLVMSEESRLGREAIETAYALKQLVTAGVRVFFYLEDRERVLESPIDKVMLSLTTFADELEREKARQRTYDAMLRKARAGHVTGGRVFGYDNVDVTRENAAGEPQRQHVVRRINESEAAVIRRIFELSADGYGIVTIAKRLNDEHALAPRSQQGRPCAWAPASVREVLHRPLYRGEIVWNRTRKRNAWGLKKVADRPEAEWLRIPAPHYQIVPDDLWTRAHDRLETARRAYLRGTRGQLHGRPARAMESKYLLTGFVRCATCGGGMFVHSRSHGSARAFFYACTSYHKRGRAVCGDHLEAPMLAADDAVLDRLQRYVLHPKVVERAIRKALERLTPELASADTDQRGAIAAELAQVERELERLADAIGAGGDIPTLVERLNARDRRRRELTEAINRLNARPAPLRPSVEGLQRELRQ